jgi:hypothetical protein
MGYWLLVNQHGRKIPLCEGPNRIGKSAHRATIVIEGSTISRLHAEILVRGNCLEIRDLHSHNGTFVNGARIISRVIHTGDEIVVGDAHLTLMDDDHPAPAHFRNHDAAHDLAVTWSEYSQLTLEPEPRSQRGRFLRTVAELGEFLVQEDGPEEACSGGLELVLPLFRFRLACLLVLNEAGEPEVRCAYPCDLGAADLQVSRCLVESVIRAGRSVLVRDAAREPDLSQSVKLKGICSALVVPLMRDARVIGILYMDQNDPRRAFHKRHLWRAELLANLLAAKLTQARNLYEMRWAALLQSAFLGAPGCPAGYEAAARLVPSALVGGDLYETLELPDGRYLYALGDVSGKGVGAALVMANALATLRALAPAVETPLELAERLRRLLAPRLAPHGFITLFLGFLDPFRHRLDYVSAGHELPVLLAAGSPPQRLESTGPPIGMDLGIGLEAAATPIPPGSLFGVWSDGMSDALRPLPRPPQPFTPQRVLGCFERLQGGSAAEVANGVFEEVEAWLGGTPAYDDRTLLVFRRLPDVSRAVPHGSALLQ